MQQDASNYCTFKFVLCIQVSCHTFFWHNVSSTLHVFNHKLAVARGDVSFELMRNSVAPMPQLIKHWNSFSYHIPSLPRDKITQNHIAAASLSLSFSLSSTEG